MLLPAVTGSGESLFVTARSAMAQENVASAPASTPRGDETMPGCPADAPKFASAVVVTPLAPPVTFVDPAALER